MPRLNRLTYVTSDVIPEADIGKLKARLPEAFELKAIVHTEVPTD